jgi:DNA repair exonuclease SbcCD ATPase subunit
MMVLEKGLPAHWDKALRKNGQLAVDVICAIQDWRLDEEVVPDARDDPAEGEDLIDVDEEIKQNDAELEQNADIEDNVSESVDEVEGEEQSQKEESESVAEEHDDAEETDDTVVGSPTQSKHDISKDDKKATSSASDKVDDLKKDFSKFSLNVVPNGLTNGDFGSLKA